MKTEEMILELLEDIRPACDFRNSTDFIKDGFLSSFDVITLATDLEDRFSMEIDGLDYLPENFSSVQKITELIKRNGGKIC